LTGGDRRSGHTLDSCLKKEKLAAKRIATGEVLPAAKQAFFS